MKKHYVLDMFPYPSGSGLHIGHAVGYVATDIYSRWMKKSCEVIHPMGFDSFGLPTEQYAISVGKSCEQVTVENILNFKRQMNNLCLDIDWDREIVTSNHDYYVWTQWIFLLLYNSWYNGTKADSIENCPHNDKNSYRLAYKAISEVNWCEELKTVLSNDEIENNKSKRGGYPVVKKIMNQWFLRITSYKERLIEGLENVEWENKSVQINWIKNRLHDVVFSRQRKWGEKFPIDGETDTMPSFAGSNWYFFRYLDNKNTNCFCSKEKQFDLPVDIYVGGAEHNTGHILYARFITKVLYDLGHSIVDEPFKKIINVGLMMGKDGQKMSKSIGNVVNPDDIIEKYGIDAFRLGLCFMGRFKDVKNWNEGSVVGAVRLMDKIKRLLIINEDVGDTEQLKFQIDADVEKFSFNTAVAKIMTFMNNNNTLGINQYNEFLNIIEPFVPNFVKITREKL